VTVGELVLDAGEVSCLYDGVMVVRRDASAVTSAIILLVTLSTVLLAIAALSALCLKRRARRRWTCCSNHHISEPNVLYTAAANSASAVVPFLPLYDDANDVVCNCTSDHRRVDILHALCG